MSFDFSNNMTKLIMSCISNNSISVLVNRGRTAFFHPSRGTTQGDLMSPYIFIMCMAKLSRIIEAKVSNGRWFPIKISHSRPKISHIFFADDLTIFARANTKNCDTIINTLHQFSCKSGQRVNTIKSKVVFLFKLPIGYCS